MQNMAARRNLSQDLWRGLAEASQPCWMIDEHRCVALVNRATLQWLGLPDDASLVGRACCGDAVLSSDRLDQAALRLAPPEAVYGSGPQTLVLSSDDQPPLAMLFVALPQSIEGLPRVLAIGGTQPIARPASETTEVQAVRQAWIRQTREWTQSFPRAPVLIGSSLAAEHLRRQAAIAGQCQAHVSLIGPRGAGLDALARGLHHAAQNAAQPPGPLIMVDAPLMDAELLDASLSPATNYLAERPEGRAGVLLREGDGLPADAQERLESVLEAWDGRLRAYTTTRRSLLRLTGFGPKLAHRLSTLELTIPPLRSRAEDIPMLAQVLLDRRQTAERVTAGWSRAALDRLVVYPWPGDLEELIECVRHAAAQARISALGPEQLPIHIRTYRPGSSVNERREQQIVLDRFLRRIERELIERAVAAARGNRAEAARSLGISRARLLRRLVELRKLAGSSQESTTDEGSSSPE
jgi:DNA-binding NtrC family response regulator